MVFTRFHYNFLTKVLLTENSRSIESTVEVISKGAKNKLIKKLIDLDCSLSIYFKFKKEAQFNVDFTTQNLPHIKWRIPQNFYLIFLIEVKNIFFLYFLRLNYLKWEKS